MEMNQQTGVCCVQQCMTGRVGDHKLASHKFPEKGLSQLSVTKQNGTIILMDRREVWQGIVGVDWITDDVVVCSRHFRKSDYILELDGEYPRLYLNSTAVPSCHVPGRTHNFTNESELVFELVGDNGVASECIQNQTTSEPININNILYHQTNLQIVTNSHNQTDLPYFDPVNQSYVGNVKPVYFTQLSSIDESRPPSLCCCVYGCPSTINNKPPLVFHEFPESGVVRLVFGKTRKVAMDRRDVWRAVLRQADIKPWTRVCSRHFYDKDYNRTKQGLRLKKEAVPSLNIDRILKTPKLTADKKVLLQPLKVDSSAEIEGQKCNESTEPEVVFTCKNETVESVIQNVDCTYLINNCGTTAISYKDPHTGIESIYNVVNIPSEMMIQEEIDNT